MEHETKHVIIKHAIYFFGDNFWSKKQNGLIFRWFFSLVQCDDYFLHQNLKYSPSLGTCTICHATHGAQETREPGKITQNRDQFLGYTRTEFFGDSQFLLI